MVKIFSEVLFYKQNHIISFTLLNCYIDKVIFFKSVCSVFFDRVFDLLI